MRPYLQELVHTWLAYRRQRQEDLGLRPVQAKMETLSEKQLKRKGPGEWLKW
jgi:hypothetical protein